MTDVSFIAMGDLHISPLVWQTARRVRGDASEALRSLLSAVLDKGVPLVLLGDIFHSASPTSADIMAFRKAMDTCREASIPVFFIQGNHDLRPVPWPSAIHPWPCHIGDGQSVDISGLRVRGFDYAMKPRIHEQLLTLHELPDDDIPDVLAVHQFCRQYRSFEGSWNLDLEWIDPRIPLTLMGDIHEEWETTFGDGQRAIYTGVSHLRELPQRGPKHCLLVDSDLGTTRLPLSYRVVEPFSVTTPDQLEKLRSFVANPFCGREHANRYLAPLAWVRYTKGFQTDIDDLIEHNEPDVLFVTKERSEELCLSFEDDSPAVTTDLISPESILAESIDPRKQPEAHRLAHSLLFSQDRVLDVIREQREQFNGETDVL